MPILNVKEEDSSQPIKMQQMTQVLTIPFVGVFIGVMVIIIEIFYKRRSTRKVMKKSFPTLWNIWTK